MQYRGSNRELLILECIEGKPGGSIPIPIPGELTFLWFKKNQAIKVDGLIHNLRAGHILCLTEFHRIETNSLKEVRFLRFNRSFYCIKDHDNEVSCKGLLFYTAAHPPIITIPKSETEIFEILWKMFSIEMTTTDNLQFEMLQMMLKRFIILCTRIYKSQHRVDNNKGNNWDLIREFNFLVEVHFRK